MRRDVDQEDEDDGLTIISEDDEADDEGESYDLFEEGQLCDICQHDQGRVGVDPTARGSYDGTPVLLCYECLEGGLKDHYGRVDGVAVVVEPFGEYSAHYYYRLDEMPAYQFVREDVEAISWLLLTIGDECKRCGEQSHFAWLTRGFIDERLPENRPVFRNLDAEVLHLCTNCAAAALAEAYRSMQLPLMTVETPRSAMGILMPTGE